MGIAESKVFAERQVVKALSEADPSQHFPHKRSKAAEQVVDPKFDPDGLLVVARDAEKRPIRIMRVLLQGVSSNHFAEHPAYRAEIRDKDGCWYQLTPVFLGFNACTAALAATERYLHGTTNIISSEEHVSNSPSIGSALTDSSAPGTNTCSIASPKSQVVKQEQAEELDTGFQPLSPSQADNRPKPQCHSPARSTTKAQPQPVGLVSSSNSCSASVSPVKRQHKVHIHTDMSLSQAAAMIRRDCGSPTVRRVPPGRMCSQLWSLAGSDDIHTPWASASTGQPVSQTRLAHAAGSYHRVVGPFLQAPGSDSAHTSRRDRRSRLAARAGLGADALAD